ncbi:DUF4391 domain-containing protein [Winogradskyella sp. SYSU M77433]|uniref:DUF4391 domain-containing protein n=1 Tax=Winogradskyella sp. SYSU M77433 TaxID=3042722 RepID=UPI002480B5D2|nr:DUF4391 domain-containing protein [Winogradskyella sp. SYSU M77433]MDH7913475.1 DUF4391 domain-containing protein [Winogradskyella sp. SYSU M77433]
MAIFELPISTKVQRVIPKNAFDQYTNSKQKKLFTDLISRIVWTHKLSTETTNLPSKEIEEIQVFKIELKTKEDIQIPLDIINKSIPYPIIFIVKFGEEMFISTSTKHPHPLNQDNSIIDWTFKSNWLKIEENKYILNLKGTLDAVYKDICIQLSGKPEFKTKSLTKIVVYQQEVDKLEKDILKLSSEITRTKQFNKKVELNTVLNNKIKILEDLKESI